MSRDWLASSGTLRCLLRWPWWMLGLAVGSAGAAMRGLLTPWIGADAPFLMAYPAVAIAATVGGPAAGILTTVTSVLWLLLPLPLAFLESRQLDEQLVMFLPAALAVSFALGSTRNRADSRSRSPDPDQEPLILPSPDIARRLQVAMVASAVVPLCMFGVAAWKSHRQALAAAEARLEHAARVAHEQALKVFETNAVLVERVHEALDLGSVLQGRYLLPVQLQVMVRQIPQVHDVTVWDAEGRAIASSIEAPPGKPVQAPAGVLQTLRGGEAASLMSGPIRAPGSGDPIFVQWMRRPMKEGRFNGLVSVGLHTRYFSEFYRELTANDPGMSISLWLADGTVVARMPEGVPAEERAPPPGAMMNYVLDGATSGLVWAVSPLDQSRRLSAFRKIGPYPVYASAGLNHDKLFAGWRAFVLLLAGITFPMGGFLVFLCWTGWQRATREAETLRRLEAETRRRAHAEEALRQAQKLEALGHLTGGVAHDVNNLLMVVNSSSYILRRLLPADERVHKQLDAISRAVETGSRLTRQLLAFSRRQALIPEVVRLQDLFPGLLELVRHSLNPGIRLEGEIAPDTTPVRLDTAELELALLNLAVNAKDAMPEGGLLRLVARNAEPHELQGLQGEFVIVSLSDTGLGIAPEVLARVFEPFFTTKALGRGTGLGLSQVYGFCAQAGGVARVHSIPGQGTTVQMLLRASDELPCATLSTALPARSFRGQVLLVEDNDEVAQATQPMLESFGYRVRRTASAAQAAALLDEPDARPDVVLSDIVMPGDPETAGSASPLGSGLALARHVRQTHAGLPVVLMTGYTSELDRAVAEGFTVLPKPCAPRALAEALARAIEGGRAPGSLEPDGPARLAASDSFPSAD